MQGVAAVDGCSRSDRGRPYEQVETDAMIDLFEHAVANDRDIDFEFTVDDYTVVVTSEGTVPVPDGSSGTELRSSERSRSNVRSALEDDPG
ncbi:hypothetical protein CP557_18350 [Natrinema ejinorense]|uniref:Halobacterial output domain-containing protein n=1 Tax=Natrinema ejinorense TaxID=373386 RepID=A0A2A5QZX2_9EURY|nr:hypothetical protein CP557_18350 [Natrinema ejinorense]